LRDAALIHIEEYKASARQQDTLIGINLIVDQLDDRILSASDRLAPYKQSRNYCHYDCSELLDSLDSQPNINRDELTELLEIATRRLDKYQNYHYHDISLKAKLMFDTIRDRLRIPTDDSVYEEGYKILRGPKYTGRAEDFERYLARHPDLTTSQLQQLSDVARLENENYKHTKQRHEAKVMFQLSKNRLDQIG